jgi:hypothetical protein
MCTSRVGTIRFGSRDSWASSKGRNPIVSLRHFRTRGKPTLPSNELSSGKDSIPNTSRKQCPSLPPEE